MNEPFKDETYLFDIGSQCVLRSKHYTPRYTKPIC
jgi:hypothetical protein